MPTLAYSYEVLLTAVGRKQKLEEKALRAFFAGGTKESVATALGVSVESADVTLTRAFQRLAQAALSATRYPTQAKI